jgi:hypothetical protein
MHEIDVKHSFVSVYQAADCDPKKLERLQLDCEASCLRLRKLMEAEKTAIFAAYEQKKVLFEAAVRAAEIQRDESYLFADEHYALGVDQLQKQLDRQIESVRGELLLQLGVLGVSLRNLYQI